MSYSIPMRRAPDVYVRSSRCSGDRLTKRQKRNAMGPQVAQQSLALRTVRIERNIHRVMVIQSPAIMNGALTKNRNWKRLFKSIEEEPLNFPGVGQVPVCSAIVANHGGGTYKPSAWNRFALRQLRLGFRLQQRLGNLRVGAGHSAVHLSYFIFLFRYVRLSGLNHPLGDKSCGE